MKTLLATIAVVAALAAPAVAQQPAGPIAVEQPWARATPGNAKTGAAYLTIVNKGTAPDRLVSVSSPVADSVMLHEDKTQNGVMMMRPAGPLAVEPGKSAQIKPGGYHLMLMGLKRPLKQGETFPMTLQFEKAGDVEVAVKVERAGAMAPGDTGTGKAAQGQPMPMNHDMPMNMGGMTGQ